MSPTERASGVRPLDGSTVVGLTQVLAEHGYDEEEIEALREDDVVG